MRHDWEDASPTTVAEVCKKGWSRRRRCRNCGAEQSYESQHLWMRVVGYRWEPPAGRCKGKKR